MIPTDAQAQELYRLCYQLTNEIYPGWPYSSIELVRIDQRTGNLFILAGIDISFEVDKLGNLVNEDT